MSDLTRDPKAMPQPRVSTVRLGRPAAPRKINIATPSYRSSYSGEYVSSLFALLQGGERAGYRFSFSSIDYVDNVASRNFLISNFYFNQADCDAMLMIDDDMGFDPDMVFAMLGLGEDVVGCLYPKRRIDLRRLHAAGSKDFETARREAMEPVGLPHAPQERRGDFLRVAACGTGILVITRNCVSRMVAAMPELVDAEAFRRMPFGDRLSSYFMAFDKIRTPNHELPVDFSFCKRWTDNCGGAVWAATSHDVRHVGQFVYETRFP